jgi:4a-hydroxytetrahydrobiopterin dehydratase
MIRTLDPQTLTQTVEKLDNWTLSKDGKSLQKSFRFKSFSQCWGFMSCIALLAEQMDHHPKWLNSYNSLDITLTTHTADGITELDIIMAQEIDKLP